MMTYIHSALAANERTTYWALSQDLGWEMKDVIVLCDCLKAWQMITVEPVASYNKSVRLTSTGATLCRELGFEKDFRVSVQHTGYLGVKCERCMNAATWIAGG
jgi:hypothetical protein